MKYILGIVLFLIATTVYFITRPAPTFEAGKETAAPEIPQEKDQNILQEDESVEEVKADPRRIAMEAEYEKLEKARRNLESRLNRLKAIFWGVEVPKEQHEAISKEMRNGYMLLKNKKLMGAYADVADISNELSRVEFINNYLQEVEDKYRAERLQ